MEAFAESVSSSGVAPGRLLIEITETARIHDIAEASSRIAALRKRGHPVCLDDFGAGAASMEYVAAFEFDFIKIDGAYVKGLVAGSRKAALIKHMALLCKDLGVVTIAEIIESPETAQVLKALGVTLGQGWAYGKPEKQPKWTPPPPPAGVKARPMRRKGTVDSWG
jgi:EAL domain-containing protein (putative c-di-GMP-specific phosphodiesterase class I)